MPGACILSRLPVALEEPLPFEWDDGRVPKKMRGLVEGGGQPTVEELLKKLDEGQEEEEEEQQEELGAQGEQPPAADKAGPSGAPALVEVGPMGPWMPLGEEAQERREVPASRSARGKERAVQAMPPPETDEEMARCLQAQEEEEEEARRGQDAATLEVVREAAGPMTWG